MRILMVISQFHPIIGGAEKQALLLAQTLIAKGIQVQVVTGWWKIGTARKEILNGIQVFRNFSFWGMFGIKGLRPLAALTYMITLGVYLVSHRKEFDIIHVHQVLHPAFISVLTGKSILKKPVLAKNACSGVTSDIKCLRQYPLGNFQLKYLIKNLDRLIGVNQEGIDEFNANGFLEAKTEHIPNGVVPSLTKKESGSQILFAITTVRLDRQKGIDVLLKSWSRVVAQERTVKLLILGKGPLESELKQLVTSLKLVDSVEFVGLVNNPEEYLRQSEIFVLPSRAEGMSNALLEAMSIGLSCIATNISGNAELISEDSKKLISSGEFATEKNGILINPDDIEGLCKAILFLVQNRKEREDMGARGQEFVRKNYSIDWVADRYIALYQSMLGKR